MNFKKYHLILLSVFSGILLSLAWFEWGSGIVLFIAFLPLLFIENYLDKTKHKYMSVNAFIDVRNQNYHINKKWPGRRLDFKSLMNTLINIGEINRAFAYNTYVEEGAKKFRSVLHHLGYEPQYKKIDKDTWYSWDVRIAVDIVNLNKTSNTLVLGSSSRSMAPIIEWAIYQGIKVIVLGCGINSELKSVCDHWIEIPEDMLEDETIK